LDAAPAEFGCDRKNKPTTAHSTKTGAKSKEKAARTFGGGVLAAFEMFASFKLMQSDYS
jgi:hypothetical protein